jgi:putative DNA primase/helicase
MSAEIIPFDQIQAVTLAQADRLLTDWFPQGRRVGRKFLVGNLQGERGDSLSVNLDTGLWKDFADGPSGHDLIDLHAARHHAGDRVAAARELGATLGLIKGTNGHAEPAAETKQADFWLPVVPPPLGTRPPPASTFSGFDVVYDYTDANDRVTHYVGRIEARGNRKKLFVPITFGTLDGKVGWHKKHPAAPLPLYGLNRLATMPGAPVILCEGEKAADAAKTLFPDHACISWCGGAERADHADLTPLHGRGFIIWPDNDSQGAKAAATIHAKLPRARVLRVADLGESDDAADVAPDDPAAWLADRLPPDPAAELRNLLSVQSWADRDIPPPDRLLGDLITTTSRAFIVGRTGLGKTMFGFALGAGLASGAGFLHWRAARPARVLIVDGEMPGELIKARSIDALRRASVPPKPGFLTIYSRDMEE